MTDSLAQLIEQATGDTPTAARAAGRLMSLLENQPQRVTELLHVAGERARRPRLLVGVTGAPGVGKSTLTDALIGAYRQRHTERRVGVIAVDPSSPFTGGAVLGDRVRMMRHATDRSVFVRSLASRGELGGLSLGVKAVLRVMGLIGCDIVFIETVGVGQSEIEIARVADHVLVVLAPGQGDAVQLLKAGLLEIGDTFVINKADRPGADELMHALTSMWADQQRSRDGSAPGVFRVVATEGEGVGALLDSLEATSEQETDAARAREEAALRDEVHSAILLAARRRIEGELASDVTLDEQVRQVIEGRATADDLATRLLERALRSGSPE